MIDIKPANKSLLDEYYGKPYPSLKGIVAVKDKKPIGVTGFYVHDGHVVVFADFTDELREEKNFKRIVVKGYKIVLNMLKTTKLPVFAEACPKIKGSEVLLEHMGFTHFDRRIYQWRP